MRSSRRLLAVVVAVIVVGLVVQVSWIDWNNRRFDASALQVVNALQPHVETASRLFGELASSRALSPDLERRLLELADALQPVQRQAEALQAPRERLIAKQRVVGLIQAIRQEIPLAIKQAKDLPPNPSPESALFLRNLMQQSQMWGTGLLEMKDQLAGTSGLGGGDNHG